MTPHELQSAIRHKTIDALLEDTSLSWENAERQAVRDLAPSLKARFAKAKRRQPIKQPDQSGGSAREQLVRMLDRINVKALRSLIRYRISPQKLAAMEAELEGIAAQRVFGVIEGGNRGPSRRKQVYRGSDGLVYYKQEKGE